MIQLSYLDTPSQYVCRQAERFGLACPLSMGAKSSDPRKGDCSVHKVRISCRPGVNIYCSTGNTRFLELAKEAPKRLLVPTLGIDIACVLVSFALFRLLM